MASALKYGSLGGAPFVCLLDGKMFESWVFSDGKWSEGNDGEVLMKGRVVSAEAFVKRWPALPDLPKAAFQSAKASSERAVSTTAQREPVAPTSPQLMSTEEQPQDGPTKPFRNESGPRPGYELPHGERLKLMTKMGLATFLGEQAGRLELAERKPARTKARRARAQDPNGDRNYQQVLKDVNKLKEGQSPSTKRAIDRAFRIALEAARRTPDEQERDFPKYPPS